MWIKRTEIRVLFTKLQTSITPVKYEIQKYLLRGFLMMPLTTLYDEYIDRSKLSEKTHLSIWPLFSYELVLLLFVWFFANRFMGKSKTVSIRLFYIVYTFLTRTRCENINDPILAQDLLALNLTFFPLVFEVVSIQSKGFLQLEIAGRILNKVAGHHKIFFINLWTEQTIQARKNSFDVGFFNDVALF